MSVGLVYVQGGRAVRMSDLPLGFLLGQLYTCCLAAGSSLPCDSKPTFYVCVSCLTACWWVRETPATRCPPHMPSLSPFSPATQESQWVTPGLHTNEHTSGETDAYFHLSLNDGIAAFPAEIPMDRDSVLKGKSSPENGTGSRSKKLLRPQVMTRLGLSTAPTFSCIWRSWSFSETCCLLPID